MDRKTKERVPHNKQRTHPTNRLTDTRGIRAESPSTATPMKPWLTRPSRRARAHDQPPDSEGCPDGRESIPSGPPSQDRRLQKAPTPHSFLRDRTATAASRRRAHFPKEPGALNTFSVYCSTENAVYTLTAK